MYDKKISKQLMSIYRVLFRAYGPQHWWPGDTPFEVLVGAVLTQNTAWTNVEKAIANLKQEKVLTFSRMLNLAPGNYLNRIAMFYSAHFLSSLFALAALFVLWIQNGHRESATNFANQT